MNSYLLDSYYLSDYGMTTDGEESDGENDAILFMFIGTPLSSSISDKSIKTFLIKKKNTLKLSVSVLHFHDEIITLI